MVILAHFENSRLPALLRKYYLFKFFMLNGMTIRLVNSGERHERGTVFVVDELSVFCLVFLSYSPAKWHLQRWIYENSFFPLMCTAGTKK